MALHLPGRRIGVGSQAKSDSGKTLILCVIFSLILLTITSRAGLIGPLGGARMVLQTVATPFRMAGSVVATPFKAAGNIFNNLTADQATLSDLQAENSRLIARNAELEESNQEADRLRQLLELRRSSDLVSTAARVISGADDSWEDTITLDKGTSSGIAVGMPVVGATGVVGQVVDCSATTSTVRLLSDERSMISAMVQESRAQGMVRGSASGQIQLTLVRSNLTVTVGDLVITSGLGGVFPKGLPIGKVTSVESAPGVPYYTITVDPLAHKEGLSEVLIVTSLKEPQRASTKDIADADAQELGASQKPSDQQTNAANTNSSSNTSTNGQAE